MFCRRLGVAIAVVLLFAASSFAAQGGSQSNVGRSEEDSTTQSGEKSKSERETQTDTNDVGGGRSTKSDSGSRSSTRKEVSRALENMRSTAMQRNLNVVGIFAKAAAEAGVIRQLHINDLLRYKLPPGSSSYQNGLQSLAAQNADASRYLKTNEAFAYIRELYRAGEWISGNLRKAKLANGMGRADWEEIANLTAANNKHAFESIPVPPIASSETCRFSGQFTRIQCGGCVLDLGYAKGLPELICSGLGMFGPESAGGETIVVQASDTHSLKDAETLAQSDEEFSGITKSVDDYVKWASSKGKAVEAAAVKRQVYSKAVKNTKGLQVPLNAMQKQEDPSKVMGFLGFK